MPTLAAGVEIIDQVKGTRRVQGGTAARRALLGRYAPLPRSLTIPGKAKPTTLVAPQGPPRFPWTWVVGGVSLSLLAGALLLRWKGVI